MKNAMATSHGNNRLLESEIKPDSIIAPQPFPYSRALPANPL
jgi:hypothetical protein